MKISVLVLTKNEEQDLPDCLLSLKWSDDIHVLDSFSTDATVAVAEQHGALVTQRSFDDWSSHQNWALNNLPFKHPWLYYSDADERVPRALACEMQGAVQDPGDYVAFRLPRRDYFRGRWLRHCIPSPFNIRLFRADSLHYERLINPVPVPSGAVGRLKEHFDHFPFSKGMSHWVAKHNAYSTLEARQILIDRLDKTRSTSMKMFTARDLNERRRHQKAFFYRLPLRPALKFLYFYVLRGGVLDGYPGLTYSILQSIYEYMIVLKTQELERQPSRVSS